MSVAVAAVAAATDLATDLASVVTDVPEVVAASESESVFVDVVFDDDDFGRRLRADDARAK